MKPFEIRTYKRAVCLEFNIKAFQRTRIYIIVEDTDRPNTQYTNRYKELKAGDTRKFFVRMPQSPEVARVKIFDKNGSFKFTEQPKILPLVPKLDKLVDLPPDVTRFVIFVQEFCEYAGFLKPGTYFSDPMRNGTQYQINYLRQIKDFQTGKEANTPARINSKTGVVQVSQNQMTQFTIPGRVAILLHEFCHMFKNNNPLDEMEADYHAANIYLALGYPVVDLLSIFATVFYRADTPLNRKRIEKLWDYAYSFNDKLINVKYDFAS